MSQDKSSVIITPGDSPLGYSFLFFLFSFLTIPFMIGAVLVPFFGFYFLYQIIHCGNHWIQVKQSEIEIHYTIFTVTISKDEFIRATLKDTGVGKLSILTLHTVSGKYYFGLVGNPKYAADIFFEFKNKTLHYDYETERHTYTQSTNSSSQKQTDYSPDTEHYHKEVFTKNEKKGKILEDTVFSFLSSSGKIPGFHRELRNLYVPVTGNACTEIDILMIHDAGIYVFECKNHRGKFYGGAHSKSWSNYYPSGKKYESNNPILQNDWHIKALADYLGIRNDLFYSCIVYGHEASLRGVPEDTNLRIISEYDNLERKLKYHIDDFNGRLSPDDIDRIYTRLEPLTKVSDEVKVKHKQDIREKYG